MIRQNFTISAIPTTVTVPGSGDMPPHIVSIGGIVLTEGVDYSRTNRVFSFPSLSQPRNLIMKEAADGIRRTFTARFPFVIPLVLVSIEGMVLAPWLFTTPTNQTVTINTPAPPAVGVKIEVSGYSPINFSVGDIGEIREV